MAMQVLSVQDLRREIDPDSLGFADTRSLCGEPLPWIGQARAQAAAQFGLALDQPGYNLFVVGEVGTGRTSLMREAMQAQAARRPVPPDLCYLHNLDAPEHPRALRLPAGAGRQLRQAMVQLVRRLQTEIPKRLTGPTSRPRAPASKRVTSRKRRVPMPSSAPMPTSATSASCASRISWSSLTAMPLASL